MQSAKEKTFKLLWENGTTKHTFKSPDKLPHHRNTKSDHDKLAHSMSFKQIVSGTEFVENDEIRRKHRWKEMLHFHNVTNEPRYQRRSIENALYANHEHTITGHHFVMSLMGEFQFENSLYFDKHLHYIYWSFEGGRADNVDWRDVLAFYYIVRYFRYIRDRTIDLIMLMFDIYTVGDRYGRSQKKGEYVLHNSTVYLRRIFCFPCILDAELYAVDILLTNMFDMLEKQNNIITHREFERYLKTYDPNLLKTFVRFVWDRIGTELRLIVLDEAQVRHSENAEQIMMRHKLTQAIAMYQRHICRAVFIEWKLVMLRESGVRLHINKMLYRRRTRFMKFWHWYTQRQQVRRRRRMLAEVIGSYSMKARCFARIKLFNYNDRRLKALVGSFDRRGRIEKLAGTHMREFRRLFNLRTYYHRWWNQCVAEINEACSARHNFERLLKRAMHPWFRYAHERAIIKRNELVTAENKLKFDRMMEEAEKDTQELIALENARIEQKRLQDEAIKEADKTARLNAAKARAKRDKDDDRSLLLQIQRDARMKRIAKEIKQIKTRFKKEWEFKTAEALEKAKQRTTAYIENPNNELAIQLKFEQLRREFYAPPTPESVEREKRLSSPQNILMLYISAKLSADQLQLSDVIPQFDKHDKGYLTYTEFGEMVRFVGATLNPSQVSAAIRAIDQDGDGFVELKELEAAMNDTQEMGVPGSPWKLYIDPAEDVICYHNLSLNQRVFEYQMTDKKLKEINLANMYGEAEDAAIKLIYVQKREEWDLTLQDYMARRMQYMYKLFRARKWRQKKIWKVDKRQLKIKTDLQRQCVRFLERTFIGFKSRELFKKQLRLTVEKVWDIETACIFWYNHANQEASWEMPRLLKRYGDTTTPLPWVPVPKPVETTPKPSYLLTNGEEEEVLYRIHYWHVTAKKDLPRKPDGLPLCGTCCRNLAVHSCHQCAAEFCWTCHRDTHSNPMGFLQKTKTTKAQYSDPVFLDKLAKFRHIHSLTKPLRCEMCASTQLCAGIHCNSCNKNLCRPCSRRIHATKQSHEMYEI